MKEKRGQILRDLRKSKNLNQSFFADMLGISLTAYQKYEHGTAEPNFDNISKLADFYGVTTDYLLGRTPPPDPFADLGISADDEKAALEKFLSLPDEVRAAILNAMREMVGAMNEPNAAEPPANSISEDIKKGYYVRTNTEQK